VATLSLVERIQHLCDKKGITLAYLQKELGFGNGSIYRWDQNSPSFDKIQKVAKYFNVTLDYLSYGFNPDLLASSLAITQGQRTIAKYAHDTGIEENELAELVSAPINQPSLETVKKLVADNPVDFLISNKDLYIFSGYDAPEQYAKEAFPPLTSDEQPKDIIKLLKREKLLSLNGEVLSPEDLEVIYTALDQGHQLAKKLNKRK